MKSEGELSDSSNYIQAEFDKKIGEYQIISEQWIDFQLREHNCNTCHSFICPDGKTNDLFVQKLTSKLEEFLISKRHLWK